MTEDQAYYIEYMEEYFKNREILINGIDLDIKYYASEIEIDKQKIASYEKLKEIELQQIQRSKKQFEEWKKANNIE